MPWLWVCLFSQSWIRSELCGWRDLEQTPGRLCLAALGRTTLLSLRVCEGPTVEFCTHHWGSIKYACCSVTRGFREVREEYCNGLVQHHPTQLAFKLAASCSAFLAWQWKVKCITYYFTVFISENVHSKARSQFICSRKLCGKIRPVRVLYVYHWSKLLSIPFPTDVIITHYLSVKSNAVYQTFTGVKTHTDLEGIFSVNVIIHRQHRYMKAWKKNASKYPFLFFICREIKTQGIDLMS